MFIIKSIIKNWHFRNAPIKNVIILTVNKRHSSRRHTSIETQISAGVNTNPPQGCNLLFNRLVTVDVVERSAFAEGLIPRVKQLFRGDFYYGHDQYFPQPFKLIDRTFVKKGVILDREEHARKFKAKT